ncbi:MAG: hypothetical protein J7647_01690 [Cyanobacteria bacterium SBLK]|nr:hypothetical protein [Cyanobacteria bacterium SBLK]
MQRVQKLDEGKFKIWWDEKPRESLTLDFNPIIEYFNLTGEFCLLHWQARPRGLRRWGIYDSASDNYYPFDSARFSRSSLIGQTLQINENQHKTVPTAVLLFEGKLIVKPLDKIKIVKEWIKPDKS